MIVMKKIQTTTKTKNNNMDTQLDNVGINNMKLP